jgi:hypothetical protein
VKNFTQTAVAPNPQYSLLSFNMQIRILSLDFLAESERRLLSMDIVDEIAELSA